VVCGFAFDPHVTEEVKKYGKLTVLPCRMNPDLAMGDDLLKKTGAGNLFMVFGEPDLEVKKLADGRLTVTVRGLDVYDPTTGEIRSSSTDDIACWFVDTDYDGESFFVRHAYFTGADEPYEKAAAGAAGGDRRGGVAVALRHHVTAVREAGVGQDRGEGDQSLRG
jgi:adenine-specific DNA-methyltransferase